jgi:hypothetical protein
MIEKGAKTMRQKINLDTFSDIKEFVNVAGQVTERVTLEDGEGHCVSAKSLLGVAYTFEWHDVYCSCERDISGLILKWIALQSSNCEQNVND